MDISGDQAESMFLVECGKRGISCSKPFSGKSAYDFITEVNGVLYKVQVKTTRYGKIQFVKGSSRKKKAPYTNKEVDFFACLNAVNGAWVIVPYSRTLKSIRVVRQTKYTEAWMQLMK